MATNNEDRKHALYELAGTIMQRLQQDVFKPIEDLLRDSPEMRERLNPAFPFPGEVRIGFLDKGLAIEYRGPARDDQRCIVHLHDAGNDSLFDFLDIPAAIVANVPKLPYGSVSNMACFLGESVTRLNELHYDYTAASHYVVYNGYSDLELSQKATFWSNVTVFWTDDAEQLHLRHVDFLQFFPSPGEQYNLGINFPALTEVILALPTPAFDLKLSHRLNQFVELLHLDGTTETTITDFLAETPELLQLAFACHELNPQVTLKWQYDAQRPDLRPDFMPIKMDGFADILDFKLKDLRNTPIVGPPARRHPSHEVDTAIAQLELYHLWCEQEVNQHWLRETKGIRVQNPQRYMVMGTSSNFPETERHRLRQTRSTTIYTYDEFIDLIRHQLYRVR